MNHNLSIAFIPLILMLTSMSSCRVHRSSATKEVATSTSRVETLTSVRDSSFSTSRHSLSSTSMASADSVTLIRGSDSTVIIHIYRPLTRSETSVSSGQASTSVATFTDTAATVDSATLSRDSAVDAGVTARPSFPLWGWLVIALAAVAVARRWRESVKSL